MLVYRGNQSAWVDFYKLSDIDRFIQIYLIITQNCMSYRSENNSQLKSMNLSLKLLNAAASSPAFHFRKSISSFQQLGNRLSMANQSFNHNKIDRESAKEWFFEKGVNISNVQDVARQVRKRQKVENIKKVERSNWGKFECDNFDDLSIEDFLHESEQRAAHFAIMSSFSTNKPSNHMNNLRKNVLQSGYSRKESSANINTKQSRDINQEEIISQFIRNYQAALNEENSASMHKVIEKVLNINKFLWLRILYYQIEMIQCLGREENKKRNYILTVSLKELEKHAKEKHYFSNQFWNASFISFRSGSTNFQESDYELDNELFRDLTVIQNKVNNFQEIFIQSSLDLNKNDNFFERILKMVILGKFDENLFDQQILDEAWMLILTLGLKRLQINEKEQRSGFKRKVKYLIAKYKKKSLDNNECLDELLAALVSLGAYEKIFKFYKELNEDSLTPVNKILFIQLFVLLASNAELIEEFTTIPKKIGISKDTKSLWKQIILEISYFAQSYKQENFEFYAILVIVITEAISNFEKYMNEDFQDLPNEISRILKISVHDLQNFDCERLSEIVSVSQVSKKVFESVLLKAQPHSHEDYFKLAELCKVFRVQELIQHIFLKFIIARHLEQAEVSKSTSFFSRGNDVIMEDILKQLRQIITKKNQHILHFSTTLLELKELVRSKNIDALQGKKKKFEEYLEDDKLINLLIKLCEKDESRLLDVYVNYYEQILAMYKLILWAKNNLTYLCKKYDELRSQLEKIQRSHPVIKTPQLGKLMVELQK